MQATVKRMLALRDWCEFFELVGADAPSMPRLNSLLVNAIPVSARRRSTAIYADVDICDGSNAFY